MTSLPGGIVVRLAKALSRAPAALANKALDQVGAMIQHRALVDRALVGDFAAVDRQRRIEQHRAGDPRRRARRGRQKFCNRSRNASRIRGSEAAAARSSGGSAGLIRRQPSRSRTTSAEISSRLMPAITTSRTSGAQAATNRARSGPTLTQVPLASLKSSAMRPSKSKPASKSSGDGRLQRVAEFVKAFLVERRRGQFRLAPIARRDVRPLGADFQLAVVRHQLGVVARAPASRHGRSGWWPD